MSAAEANVKQAEQDVRRLHKIESCSPGCYASLSMYAALACQDLGFLERLSVAPFLQATEAKLKQAEQGERELQAALRAAQQDAVEAATSAARADKELRAQRSMSAQHQRLLRQVIARHPPRVSVAPCGASVAP